MKLIGLIVNGIRKLTAVEMTFGEKGLIQFRGRNGQGKTSILDSIEILLKGNKYIESDMIQHGKHRAEIIGYLGDYEVKRVITEKSNRLEIKTSDGLEITEKPQAFLDRLINQLTFDPRPFLNKTSEQKLRFLMDVMEINFDAIDKDIAEKTEERLLLGREIKKIGELAAVVKAERVDIGELLTKKKVIDDRNTEAGAKYQVEKDKVLKGALAFNEEQRNRERAVSSTQTHTENLKQQVKEYQEALVMAEKSLESLARPEALKDVENLDVPEPAIEETVDLERKISEAGEINKSAEEYETFERKKKEKNEKQQKYDDHDNAIKALRDEKKVILAKTKMPVKGLEIREDGLYHNGIFSENWGEQEGLRISSELCVAMSPELRAIFIDKGESYDVDNLKELEKWAIDNDIQAFITIVDDAVGDKSGNGVFYIEEGKIEQ